MGTVMGRCINNWLAAGEVTKVWANYNCVTKACTYYIRAVMCIELLIVIWVVELISLALFGEHLGLFACVVGICVMLLLNLIDVVTFFQRWKNTEASEHVKQKYTQWF